MIRTTDGTPCVLVAAVAGTLVQVRLVHGDAMHLCDLSDLRADGGPPELDAALTRGGGVYGHE